MRVEKTLIQTLSCQFSCNSCSHLNRTRKLKKLLYNPYSQLDENSDACMYDKKLKIIMRRRYYDDLKAYHCSSWNVHKSKKVEYSIQIILTIRKQRIPWRATKEWNKNKIFKYFDDLHISILVKLFKKSNIFVANKYFLYNISRIKKTGGQINTTANRQVWINKAIMSNVHILFLNTRGSKQDKSWWERAALLPAFNHWLILECKP